MKFAIHRSSDYAFGKLGNKPCEGAVAEGDDWFIEIGSLEDLMSLIRRERCDLIVGSEPSIWLYDDRME